MEGLLPNFPLFSRVNLVSRRESSMKVLPCLSLLFHSRRPPNNLGLAQPVLRRKNHHQAQASLRANIAELGGKGWEEIKLHWVMASAKGKRVMRSESE
jgi:hypothetical protein